MLPSRTVDFDGKITSQTLRIAAIEKATRAADRIIATETMSAHGHETTMIAETARVTTDTAITVGGLERNSLEAIVIAGMMIQGLHAGNVRISLPRTERANHERRRSRAQPQCHRDKR